MELKNWSETAWKSGDENVFVVEAKKMVLRCLLKLASEIRPYTSSTEQGGDEFLKYVAEREVMELR